MLEPRKSQKKKRDNIPAEYKRQGKYQTGILSSNFSQLDGRDHHVRKGGRKKKKGPHEQEHQDTAFRSGMCCIPITIHADWIIPRGIRER